MIYSFIPYQLSWSWLYYQMLTTLWDWKRGFSCIQIGVFASHSIGLFWRCISGDGRLTNGEWNCGMVSLKQWEDVSNYPRVIYIQLRLLAFES